MFFYYFNGMFFIKCLRHKPMRPIITWKLEFKMNETDWRREYNYLKAVLLNLSKAHPHFYMML